MFPPNNGAAGPNGPGAAPPRPPMAPPGSPMAGAPGPQGASSAIQAELMQRARTITPQDVQALKSGVSPQAAAIIKRLLPEIGPLIDKLMAMGAPGGPPQTASDADGDEGMPPQPTPQGGGLPRPVSRLGQM